MIQPIETRFAGRVFRSRTEARWAAFFEVAGLHWEYEPEAFKLSDGSVYLPDFLVTWPSGEHFYAEVKPSGTGELTGFNKAKRFVADARESVLLLPGPPAFRTWTLCGEMLKDCGSPCCNGPGCNHDREDEPCCIAGDPQAECKNVLANAAWCGEWDVKVSFYERNDELRFFYFPNGGPDSGGWRSGERFERALRASLSERFGAFDSRASRSEGRQ